MFSGIDFLLKRTMSSFFNAIKNLLTAYHIDKSSTGKIIEPTIRDVSFLMIPSYLRFFIAHVIMESLMRVIVGLISLPRGLDYVKA